VIGRQFSHQQLLAVLNAPAAPTEDRTSEDRLFEILEEALAARVIEETPSAVGQYQFTHALIQETLTNELSTTRRVKLHARIADALENLYGSKATEYASELAGHYSEAEAMIGGAKLIKYSIAAGNRANADMAYEDALAHFARALHARGNGTEDDDELASILAGAARAELSGSTSFGQQRGLDYALRAFRYYKKTGQIERAFDVACIPFRNVFEDSAEAITLEALELATGDSAQVSFLLSRRAMQLASRGRIEGTLEMAGQAIEMAERLGATNALAWAKYRKFSLLGMLCQQNGHSDLMESAIELSQQTKDPLVELLARGGYAEFLARAGMQSPAMEQAGATVQLAHSIRDLARVQQAVWIMSRLLLLEGRWDEAREIVAPDPGHLDFTNGVRLEIASQTGDSQGAMEALAAARNVWNGTNTTRHLYAIGMAWIAGACHRADASEELTLSKMPVRERPTPMAKLAGAVADGIVAIHSGNRDLASSAYETLARSPFASLGLTVIPVTMGELQLFLGNWGKAVEHFDQAVAICEKAGWMPELAWAKFFWAEALIGRNGPGDSARGRELQDQSLAVAQKLGMKPLVGRVLARKKILKA
jgi:tetratricopeptide (TPR) repeat protein